MATSEPAALDGCSAAPQLKIVLLGGRNCGKSSLGNLILGKEEFVPRERTSCCRRLGVVAGRRVTVVDTPGWWCDFSSRDTPELVKREIVSGAALCAPGPHAFLLTVKASAVFSEKRRRAVEEHVSLLGEKVWSHCVLVLVSADRRELARGGGGGGAEALRWLAGKCGHRCRRVVSGDVGALGGLLEEIQKLVTRNGNGVFEVRGSVARATAEEKRRVEERARRRFVMAKEHRSLMRESLRPVSSIRIVLVGAKGSGKSSTMDTILSTESGQRVRRTARCVVGTGPVFGRQVTVVDTPGWWANYFCAESPVFDRRELALGASLCPPGPNVVLLVIRADRAFSETHGRAAEEHMRLIGERVWRRVIVLLSCGDWLAGTTAEQCVESEAGPLRGLVERCGNRCHVLNNKTRGDQGYQVRELILKIEEMLAGRSGRQHIEVERPVVEQLEEERRREGARTMERLARRERQRQMARSQLEKLNVITELRIVLIGGRKTGKSSCGDTILNRERSHAENHTTSCWEKPATIGGKTVVVLDTPARFTATPDLLRPASCAILPVVNVSSSFSADHLEAMEKQLEAGGGQMWRRAAVLFSHGDWLGDTSIEQRIESEGEPLRRLVERCGNRYHVLDNKHRADGAQVNELIALIEETLVEDRGGDRVTQGVTRRDKGRKRITSCRHQVSRQLIGSANPTTSTPRSCSGGPDGGARIVALPAARTAWAGPDILVGDALAACLASMLSGGAAARWTMNPPGWLPNDVLHLRLSGARRPLSSKRPTMLLVAPQTQRGMLAEENGISVHSLCRPAPRERTLAGLSESGGLQALIDQWGDSSLEELEAFIDSYFEMIWEKTVGSLEEPVRPTADVGEEVEEEEKGEDEVLSSINRKLSKLELLDEIRRDLAELRASLENSWRAIQELRERSKQDGNQVDTNME